MDKVQGFDVIGNEMIAELRRLMKAKDANATGAMSDSFRYENTEQGFFFYALDYAYQIEHGTPPKSEMFARLAPKIYDWATAKRVTSNPKQAIRIAAKIFNYGTIQYRIGAPRGIFTAVINDELNERFAIELAKGYAQFIANDLKTIFK